MSHIVDSYVCRVVRERTIGEGSRRVAMRPRDRTVLEGNMPEFEGRGT